MRKILAIILALTVTGLGTALPAEAKTFKSCTILLKTYPTGIALSSYSKNVGGILTKKPKVLASIYRQNIKLDTDKDGLICESVKQVPEVAPLITLANLDQKWTLKVAITNTLKLLEGVKPQVNQPIYVTSPNTSKSEIDIEKRLVSEAMLAFAGYFRPNSFKVVMFTNLDGAWADKAFVEHGGSFPGQVSQEIEKQTGRGGCTFAFATENSASREPIFYECTDTRFQRPWSSYQTPIHEYFHLVHQGLAPVQTPVWLFEGSASFFGEVLGYRNFKDPELCKARQNFNTTGEFDPDGVGRDPNRFQNWIKTAKPEDLVKIFERLESEPSIPREKLAHYSLGSWATEVLVAVYGVEKYMELWTELGKRVSFDQAFQSVFGVTKGEFYLATANYIKGRVRPETDCAM